METRLDRLENEVIDLRVLYLELRNRYRRLERQVALQGKLPK